MDTWIQNYTAVGGSLYLTAAVALLPIIFFFVALTVLKLTACAGMTEERIETGKIGDICDTANKVTVAQRSSETPLPNFQTSSKSDTCLFTFNLLYLAAGN